MVLEGEARSCVKQKLKSGFPRWAERPRQTCTGLHVTLGVEMVVRRSSLLEDDVIPAGGAAATTELVGQDLPDARCTGEN